MDLDRGARPVVRHLLLPGRRRFYNLNADRGPTLQDWAVAVRLRPADRHRRRPRERRARADARLALSLLRRPSLQHDRPDLEARLLGAARDRPGRPRGDAAPDGALLRDDRERRRARHAAHRRGRRDRRRGGRRRRRSCASSRPSSRPRPASTRPTSRRCSRGSTTGRTRSTAPPTASSASSRSRSPARPAPPRRTSTIPGYPNPLELNQSWWCGYGPFDNPSIVVCAVIENGGHGGTAAAPAALQVFEAYFQQVRHRDDLAHHRLMPAED